MEQMQKKKKGKRGTGTDGSLLPLCTRQEGQILLTALHRVEGLPLFFLRISFPDPEVPAREGKEAAARARIAGFYTALAEGMAAHAQSTLLPRLLAKYEAAADAAERRRFPHTVLRAEGRVTEEESGFYSVLRRTSLTLCGRTVAVWEESEVFSLASGRLCPLRLLRPHFRKNESEQEAKNVISRHTGPLQCKALRSFLHRRRRNFYVEDGQIRFTAVRRQGK